MTLLCREFRLFLAAIGFFTRLPVPCSVSGSAAGLRDAARYLPAVGLLVGGIAATTWFVAAQFWPPMLAILLSMAATLHATGAFHEDGLADTADGLGGGWEKTRILEIMKDSRIGSYGVVALCLVLAGKFLALSALDAALLPAALLAGHAVSRFAATCLLATMDYARDDATSRAAPVATRLSGAALAMAGGCALTGCLGLPWPQVLAGAAACALATLWLAAKFRRWLGGYTGDCLGAVQQVGELAFYLGLLARWPA